MDNFIIKNGVKIYRTPKQIAEIEAWKTMTDKDIDLSDIPEITEEEFARMVENRRRRKKLQAAS